MAGRSAQPCLTSVRPCRQIQRDTGVWLDRTERLANSLARLVLTVQQLNQLPDGMKVGRPRLPGPASSARQLPHVLQFLRAEPAGARHHAGTSASPTGHGCCSSPAP